MNTDFLIFAVDDASATCRVLEASLGKDYGIETFGSAEECLQRLDTQTPDLFLLDVGLPGIDGYELCRLIKVRLETTHVPVIFISSLDDLDSRLKGYDAGGEEFIVKPYKMADLKQKIEVIRRFISESAKLRQQANESESLTSLILSNLDEYAVLIKFLRELNLCQNTRDIASALFNMLKGYHIEGAVQIRLGRQCVTLSPDGTSNPLEESVINHLRNGDRIVQFKTRAAFNFPNLTLLTTNLPIHDTDLTGRLRDHLAIAAEVADGRLLAMSAIQSNEHTRGGITELTESLNASVTTLNKKFDEARAQASMITFNMLSELSASFTHLGMSGEQEERIKGIVEARAYELSDTYDFAEETRETLHGIQRKLGDMLQQ